MTPSPHVLLVAPTPRLAAALSTDLVHSGCRVTLVTSFKAARTSLESCPDLLISEVRLGEYNGLHLALRAQSGGIRAIVVGDADQATQREAEMLGAAYLPDDGDSSQLQAAMHAAGVSSRGRARDRATNAA